MKMSCECLDYWIAKWIVLTLDWQVWVCCLWWSCKTFCGCVFSCRLKWECFIACYLKLALLGTQIMWNKCHVELPYCQECMCCIEHTCYVKHMLCGICVIWNIQLNGSPVDEETIFTIVTLTTFPPQVTHNAPSIFMRGAVPLLRGLLGWVWLSN